MTSYQEAYEKMSLARSLYLVANATITSTLTGFSTYFPVIQTTHNQILTAKILQEANKSGDTTAKNQLRASLIVQAMEIIRRVVAYATNTNNTTTSAPPPPSTDDTKNPVGITNDDSTVTNLSTTTTNNKVLVRNGIKRGYELFPLSVVNRIKKERKQIFPYFFSY